jgi:hypothetical protein
MNHPKSDAEQLREEMRRLRSHMDADVDSFVENTRGLFDWHSYFRSAPWLCLGAAALTGYVLIPSKARTVTVDLEKLAELAKHRQVVVTDRAGPAKASAGAGLGKMAFDLLWRTALSVGMQQLNRYLTPRPHSSDPSPGAQRPGTPSPGTSRRRPAGGEGK